jgi:hypothetical protein
MLVVATQEEGVEQGEEGEKKKAEEQASEEKTVSSTTASGTAGKDAAVDKPVRRTSHSVRRPSFTSEQIMKLTETPPIPSSGSKLFGDDDAQSFRICTLNVGGRNTNSFEFLMAGDSSELGQRWQAQYKTAMSAIAYSGPATTAGLDVAMEALHGYLGEDSGDLIESLLDQKTWSAMIAEATKCSPRLFNAINMASLKAGRPSPLERPESVDPDNEFLAQWLAWAVKTLPKERENWEKRIRKKNLQPLPTCLAAMLLFDCMCADVVKTMHAEELKGRDSAADGAQESRRDLSFGAAMRHHCAMCSQLPHTTEEGKYKALDTVLERGGFPEVVCLQEASVLMGKEPVAKYLPHSHEKYNIFKARRETVLLLRNTFEGALVPESKWYTLLAQKGQELAWELKADWDANLEKTCIVETTWAGQPAVVISGHYKPSEATTIFIVALQRILETFPLVIIGMDANTPAGKQVKFGKLLQVG